MKKEEFLAFSTLILLAMVLVGPVCVQWLVGTLSGKYWGDYRLLGYFLKFFIICGAGIGGIFFMLSNNKDARIMRIFGWGFLQLFGSWFAALGAATMTHMNDGEGMAFVLFAPLCTLPSYLIALVISLCNRDLSDAALHKCHRMAFGLMLASAIIVFSLYTVKQVEALQYNNAIDFYESI